MSRSDELLTSARPADPVVVSRERGKVTNEAPTAKPKRQRRAKPQKARAPPDDDALDAFTITEFCRRHMISEAFYFKLRLIGLAPQTMKVGNKRTLITREAAARWRAERERDAIKIAKERDADAIKIAKAAAAAAMNTNTD